jgi:hypothetical protein
MTFDVAGVKKMAELKTGDNVMVPYTEKDGKMVAKDIFVTTGNLVIQLTPPRRACSVCGYGRLPTNSL